MKALNPFPIRDDAFVSRLDLTHGIPHTAHWVRFLDGFWENDPFDDRGTSVYIGKSREAEIRLFVVKSDSSFEEISREIDRLVSVGFRPTTIRHLVAFCNTDNAKNLNPEVTLIISTPPSFNFEGSGRSRIDGFYSAITKKDEIVIGIVLPRDLPELSEKIVLLEAPIQ